MSGRGFSLEEDWLYKAVSARFFMLKLTVFEGILLVVDNGEGSMPDAAALIRNAGVHEAAEKMRRLLGAETMRAAVSGGSFILRRKTGCFTSLHWSGRIRREFLSGGLKR